MVSIKFFISHSSKNAEIAKLLSDYLQKMLDDSNVFCSSYSDTFRSGDDFSALIMKNINSVDCFIPILTEDFYRSRYCLIELGFACGLQFSKQVTYIIAPFSLPPIKDDEALKGTPLEGRVTVKSLNNFNHVKDFFIALLEKADKNCPTDFNEKIKSFVDKLNSIKTSDASLLDFACKYAKCDPVLLQHVTQGFFWGSNISVVPCTNTRDWWSTSDLQFKKTNAYDLSELCKYDLDLNYDQLIARYKDYMKNEFTKKYTIDKKKYMLANRYYSTIDNPGIILELKETSWGVFRFFVEKLLTDEKRKKYVDGFFDTSKIFFPNSLCLHLVILTINDKVLITKIQGSNHADVPNCWAVSIGEQIDATDLENKETDIAEKWVRRALLEEVGVTIDEGHYTKDDIRFMSINLEADIVNFAACCMVRLRMTDEELTKILQDDSKHRDKEAKIYEFMDINDIPSELISPSRVYHPASHLRMAYAYIYDGSSKKLKEALNAKIMEKINL